MSEKSERNGLEIAIVGMSGRFPGANNLNQFWENLKNGVNSIRFFTGEELLQNKNIDADIIHRPNYVKAMGILENSEYFDASFFGYSPLEAEILDPQIRVFTEICWEALEDAGCDPTTFKGPIGLFAGGSGNHSWEVLTFVSGKEEIFGDFAAENLKDKDYLSSRISHKLDLKGPAISIHTACSTALVAADLACRSLLTGQCDAALAGGVSVLSEIARGGGYLYEEGLFRSPDGLVRAFDREANGTVFSHGAGVVLLKRLDDAAADGDDIYAVIKGFAANNDGISKSSFTAPAVDGQAAVIRTALYMAEVEPETITYVEAHGTATRLGDPIEIEALKTAFHTNKTQYCAIGSVKTNIGHLDTAAGIAGMIKVLLMMKHRQIPPSLNYKKPNPEIDFEHSPFFVNIHLREWNSNGEPLRAGISSFGVGGTNAHLILEQAPGQDKTDPPTRPYQLLLLSARTANALQQASKNFLDYLKENPHTNLADAAFTLNTGRKAFEHKKMLVCQDVNEALQILEQEQQQGDEHEQQTIQTHYAKEEKRAVFMFPGQGSQYVEMARGVYETEPLFRQEMDRCFEILKPLLDYDLKEIIYPSAEGRGDHRSNRSNKSYIPSIDQTETAQPLIFAIEYALARLLMSWGIAPYAMIGHSIGEYTAACLAGVFTLEDALFIVVWRGKLMQQMPPGSMLSVALPEPGLKQLLNNEAEGKLDLAAVNGPSQCVVSGTHEDIDAFAHQLEEKNIQSRKLHTSHAYHSKMMEPILNTFREKVSQVKGNAPQIPFISNLTGQWFTYEDAANPNYWVRHLRGTVRFSDGLKELLKDKNVIFIEVGPGSTLATFTRQHPDKSPEHMLIDLVRHPKKDVPDENYLLSKLGQTWLYGKPIDWQQFYSREKRHRLHLPTYPFQRQRYWIEGNPNMMIRERMIRGGGPGKKPDISQWFYIPSWKRSIIASGSKEESAEETQSSLKWLVFADADDVNHGNFASLLLERLTHEKENDSDSDGDVTVVKIGTAFARQQDSTYTIAPAQENHYEALIEALQASGNIPDRIVHLWNLTPALNENQEPVNENKRVEKSLDLGFYSLIYLAKALGKQPLNREIQVIVLTNGMQEVWGEPVVYPGKAVVLAPIMIIPREYPDIKCRCIDIVLPKTGKETEKKKAAHNNENENKLLIDRLLREFKTGISDKDTIIAYRGNNRLVRTFEPIRLSPPDTQFPALRLRKAGVYLITGGTGGIGLELARYLAKTLQAKLILTGRSAFPGRQEWDQWLETHPSLDSISQKIRKIKELEALGAEVRVYSADSVDGPAMSGVIEQTRQQFGTINGVIHSAGVPGGGIIQLKTREMADQVLAPKVKGTLALHRALQDQGIRPDFIVLCSSVNSVVPIIGQVDYCAANAFMDAFAFYLNARDNDSTFTVSINWDPWQEVGMAVAAALANIKKFTMKEVSPEISATLKEKEQGTLPGSAHAQTPVDRQEYHLEETSREELVKDGISPLEGVEVFTRILETRDALPQVVVSPQDLASRLEASQIPESPGTEEWMQGPGTTGPVYARPDISTPYIAPTTSLQQKMANTWQELLGIAQVGIKDDFFELGGDSLKAAVLISRIHKAFHVNIPLKEIFNHPTIAQLAIYIENASKEEHMSIEPVEKKEYYPVSSPQKRLYLIQQMELNSTAYNIPKLAVLEGRIDKPRWHKAFEQLIHRHESLRTSFILVNDEPVQEIHEEVEFEIKYHSAAEDTENTGKIHHFFTRPFDLSKAPLSRVGLMRLQEQKHFLMLNIHHIITDNASLEILITEVIKLYAGETLKQLPLQYKDFSAWQNKCLVSEALKSQDLYWQKQFAGEIPVMDFPMDYPRPEAQSFAGNTVHFQVPGQQRESLKSTALGKGLTMFMMLLGIFDIFLAKISGQEDILVGIPTAGRQHTDLQPIIGMFVNTLVSRNYAAAGKKLDQFLEEVKENTLNAFANQDYQFEMLIDKIGLKRDLSRNPLFNVMFSFNTDPDIGKVGEIIIPGLKLKGFSPDNIPASKAREVKGEKFPYENKTSKFDLTLKVSAEEDEIDFGFEYCRTLFKESTVQRFIGYFKQIVESVIEHDNKGLNPGIADIDIIPGKEKELLLYHFNDTRAAFPLDKTIQQLFSGQVKKNPDHIAVVGSHETNKSGHDLIFITYREFERRADVLARVLKSKGVKANTAVGIMAEPLPAAIIAIMAILKTGGFYLPLDPEQPPQRISYMLADSQIRWLTATASSPIQFAGEFIDIDNHNQTKHRLDQEQNQEIPSGNQGNHFAYMIYTSGTTGKPKGVLLRHNNLVNYVCWFKKETRLNSNDRSLLTASFAFDLGYTSIYPCLLSGGQLYLAARDTYATASYLIDYIYDHAVTYLKLTPSLFSIIAENPGLSSRLLRTLRLVVLGGEEIRTRDVENLHAYCPHIQFINHYGPTEATIGTIAQQIDFSRFDQYRQQPTIGKPISNSRVYILDKQLQLLPIGIPGELFLSGVCLASGYLNNPELTEEKFIRAVISHSSLVISPSKFSTNDQCPMTNDRFYRTGDLARWLAAGNIEFLGRVDQQVKVRGYRVELGEIENLITRYRGIKDAAVLVNADKTGDKYLCAYITLAVPGEPVEIPGLTDYLSQSLPGYMVPAAIVVVERIPLTPNGKIDRRALPEPGIEQNQEQYQEPRDEIEKKLVGIWTRVLGRENQEMPPIGIEDNFFRLGGQSLKATSVTARVHKELHIKMPLSVVFQAPTIKDLAAYIRKTKSEIYTAVKVVEKREYYELSSAQKRLYVVQQMEEENTVYNMPWALQLTGTPDKPTFETALSRLIARHESLRTSFLTVNGEPMQKIRQETGFAVEYYDLRATGESDRCRWEDEGTRGPAPLPEGPHPSSSDVIRHLSSEFIRPFDLAKTPLLRVGLVKLKENHYILLLDIHHIIFDEVSRNIFIYDLLDSYAGKQLPALRLQYKDFSQWHNQLIRAGSIKEQEEYWLKRFPGEIPLLNIPIDYQRPDLMDFQGYSLHSRIDGDLFQCIKEFAARVNVTLNAFLLAAYNVLLSKYTGQSDLLVGHVIAGRRHADLQLIIGFFVNMLAIKNHLEEQQTFEEILNEVKQTLIEAYDNQDYQFDELVNRLGISRAGGRHPLIDTVFVFQDPAERTAAAEILEEGGLTISPYDIERKISHFDLMFHITALSDSIHLTVEYSSALFKQTTIQALADSYIDILEQILENNTIKLENITIQHDFMTGSMDNLAEEEFDFEF